MQENLEEQKIFNTHLEALDKQMQSTVLKMEARFSEQDSVQVGQKPFYFSQMGFPIQY